MQVSKFTWRSGTPKSSFTISTVRTQLVGQTIYIIIAIIKEKPISCIPDDVCSFQVSITFNVHLHRIIYTNCHFKLSTFVSAIPKACVTCKNNRCTLYAVEKLNNLFEKYENFSAF